MLVIAFDDQSVIAAALDDLRGDFFLTAHGIDRHQSTVKVQQLQEQRNRRDFIGFGSDGDLAEAEVLSAGPGADQVQWFEFGRPRATQGLAIDRHVFDPQGGADRLDPAAKAGLKGVRIEAVEHSFKRVMRRDAVGQSEKTFEPVESIAAKGFDLLPILGVGDHGTKGDDNDVLKMMEATMPPPRVFNLEKWWTMVRPGSVG